MAGFWTNREASSPVVYSGEQGRIAKAKHEIEPRIVSKAKKDADKKKNGETFRAAVWLRDKGICRATRVPLAKSGLDHTRVGEVDHTLLRSTHPEMVYDPTNGVLIQKHLNRLRKVRCRNNPEFLMFDYTAVDPTDQDRGKPQIFRWRDADGKVTKETRG